MTASLKKILGYLFLATVILFGVFVVWQKASALNVLFFKDTISSSKPGGYSNHKFDFTLNTDIAPGGYFEFTPPSGFTILSTSTFGVRNVEMYVNGSPRPASSTLSSTLDQVIITPGSPGSIRYNLNSSTGVGTGDDIQFRIGANTSNSFSYEIIYNASNTSTTTVLADVGLRNSTDIGTHKFVMTTGGGDSPAYAGFLIAIIDQVGIRNVDTTEEIPPVRFNGAPSGEIGGTTLNVEISLETDELAVCRYSTTAGVDYASMTETFTNTGLIVHSQEVSVLNSTAYTFYVRCIDDEGNFNIDDYEISFTVPEEPSGEVNGDGNNNGDGSGTGDTASGGTGSSGTGGGGGSGSSSGGGGGGGGSGGGSGSGSGADQSGGSNNNGPYESGDAQVIVNGYAFPNSRIIILVDGQQAVTDQADSQGKFSATIDAIARGVYTFGVYAIDTTNTKSSTFSTTFSVQGARTSTLSNINIMPSIKVSPDPVNPGQTLKVSGYSIPNSNVTIENQKDKSNQTIKTFNTTSGSNGAWSIDVDTTGFSQGTYKVRAKSSQSSGVSTNFSNYTFYGVGQIAEGGINADLNRDGKVNLVDFSILLFWWGGSGGDSDPPADINGDGNVSLTDFSIMLFNWTG